MTADNRNWKEAEVYPRPELGDQRNAKYYAIPLIIPDGMTIEKGRLVPIGEAQTQKPNPESKSTPKTDG